MSKFIPRRRYWSGCPSSQLPATGRYFHMVVLLSYTIDFQSSENEKLTMFFRCRRYPRVISIRNSTVSRVDFSRCSQNWTDKRPHNIVVSRPEIGDVRLWFCAAYRLQIFYRAASDLSVGVGISKFNEFSIFSSAQLPANVSFRKWRRLNLIWRLKLFELAQNI